MTSARDGLATISRPGLATLIQTLNHDGNRVIGPTVRDGAIVCDDIAELKDLPVGWTDRQQPGAYHAEENYGGGLFDHGPPAQSWKRFLHPPTVELWHASMEDGVVRVSPPAAETRPLALLGVRACDLAAIKILDTVLLDGVASEPHYRARRRRALIIAVSCRRPADTCFCADMGHGPVPSGGFDLALTEIDAGETTQFVVAVGSGRGAALLRRIDHRPATGAEASEADRRHIEATARVRRRFDFDGVPELLERNLEAAQWDDVAERCLACGNCTSVCPTCFCTSNRTTTGLDGETTGQLRHWASCFASDFSFVHGGSIRESRRSRYRQWATHKMSTWVDQFGEAGCVGCGRCITWCPVGIDIRREVEAIRAAERAKEVAR